MLFGAARFCGLNLPRHLAGTCTRFELSQVMVAVVSLLVSLNWLLFISGFTSHGGVRPPLGLPRCSVHSAQRVDGGMVSLAWTCLVAAGVWAETRNWNVLKTAFGYKAAALLASAVSTFCSPYFRILGTSTWASLRYPIP